MEKANEYIMLDIPSLLLLSSGLMYLLVMAVNLSFVDTDEAFRYTLTVMLYISGFAMYGVTSALTRGHTIKRRFGMIDLQKAIFSFALAFVIVFMLTFLGTALVQRFASLSKTDQILFNTFVAFGEEAFFRGFLYNVLFMTTKNKYFANIFQASIFGSIHMMAYGGDFGLMVIAIGAALVFGFVDINTNSLFPSLLAHGTWNFLVMLGG